MTTTSEEDDPVVAEYDVYITANVAEQIHILQYPNRDREQPYNAQNSAKPAAFRVKPRSGFVELDVPMNVAANFDRVKGIRWGKTLRKAKDAGITSFGLSSGFNAAAGAPRPSRAAREDQSEVGSDEEVEEMLSNFEEANMNGQVLNEQTLGGQTLPDELGKPIYMLGAFRGKGLHLTKVDGLVHMGPQFHHLDAEKLQESSKRRRDREGGEPPRPTEPRAVQMTIKAGEGDNVDLDKTKEFLKMASEERWRNLKYQDESTDDAFAIFHKRLFAKKTKQAAALRSSLTTEGYLDAMLPLTRGTSRPRRKSRRRPRAAAGESSRGGNIDLTQS